MTKNERIAELERAIAALEARIVGLEARPAYYTIQPAVTQQIPTWPPRPWVSPNICSAPGLDSTFMVHV